MRSRIADIRNRMFLFFLLLSLDGRAEGDGRFHLFHADVKQSYPSVVYDFLESYLYKLDSLQYDTSISVGERLKRDGVTFVKGYIDDVRNITEETPFEIGFVEGKSYDVVWKDPVSGSDVLHISFPASYELIFGQPKYEIEREVSRHLAEMPVEFEPYSRPEDIEMINFDYKCFAPGNIRYLDIKALNNQTYYYKTDDGGYVPIFDSERIEYSAANLLHGVIADCDRYQMHIVQSQYDFHSETYFIRLSQWLNYCREMDAVIYVAHEESSEAGLKMLVIAHSSALGFHHMMSILLPHDFVDNRESVIKAKFNAFIPVHNVHTIYQEKLQPLQK